MDNTDINFNLTEHYESSSSGNLTVESYSSPSNTLQPGNYLYKFLEFALNMALYFDPTSFIIGIIGNTLAAMIFYVNSQHHTSLFLGALAITDLGQCLCGLAYWYYVNLRMQLTKLQCQILVFFLTGFILSSTWTVTLMTLEKYLAVRFPLNFRNLRRKKVIVNVIIATCTTAVIMAFPMVYVIYNGNGTTCNIFVYQTMFNYVYNWIMTSFHFLIPFSILVVFNVLIMRAIRKSREHVVRISASTSVSTVSCDDSTDISEGSRQMSRVTSQTSFQTSTQSLHSRTQSLKNKKASENEKQMTIMFFTVTFSFFILCVLFHIRTLLFMFFDVSTMRLRIIYSFLLLFSRSLLFINSSINFYLYIMVSYKFRANLRHLLRC